jgi:hypothetical protein
MTGTATFSPEGEHLVYREEGVLRLVDGTEVRGEREYIYGSRQDGFAVYFRERPPRLFHEVRLVETDRGQLNGHAEHECGKDHYFSTYQLRTDGGLIIRHAVCGSRKDYVINTTYRRAVLTRRVRRAAGTRESGPHVLRWRF